MKYTILILMLLLTGCAGSLRGFAQYMDSQDLCQTKSRAPGQPAPDYCGASQGKIITVTPAGTNRYIINRY